MAKSQVSPVDLAKPLFRPGEVMRILRKTPVQLTRLVESNRLRRVMRGRQWRYNGEDVRALHRLLSADPNEKPSDGKIHAAAVALLESGRTDAQVVKECGLSLGEVERLRLAMGGTPTADERLSEIKADTSVLEVERRLGTSARERVEKARAEVRERVEQARRRAFGGKS